MADESHAQLPAAPRQISRLVYRSGLALCVVAAAFTLVAVGTLVSLWPIRVQEDFQAYLQCDGPQRGRWQAYQDAKHGQLGHDGRRLQQTKPRTVPKFFIKVIYATPDGSNVFTPELITRIRDVERGLANLPSYGRHCLLDGLGHREEPLSVINYFFASIDRLSGDIVPNGRGDEILDVQAILANIAMKDTFFVDRFFGVSTSQVQSMLEGNVTRSVFRFALPLPGYAGPDDRHGEQEQKFRSFVADELYPYLRDASTDNLRVYFYGDVMSAYEVESTVWHDASYATGSFVFILIYLVIYLRSPFLALGAIFCIALSFPLSYAVYCIVYGQDKMIAINFLSLFVVLGVGADDVFVLSDVWHHSRCHGLGEMALARRFWSMYRKAGAAIFATSATTAVSFFANVASSIGPLRQFGFFMGTCITMNWLVVATVYPLMLVASERRRPGSGHGSPGAVCIEETDGATEMQESFISAGTGETGDARSPSSAAGSGLSESASGKPCRDLGWRMGVRAVSALGLAVPAAALYSAAHNLRPSNGVPQFFPPGSNLGDLQELQNRFGNESSVASVHLKQCGSVLTAADQDCGKQQPTPIARIPGALLQPRPTPAPRPAPPPHKVITDGPPIRPSPHPHQPPAASPTAAPPPRAAPAPPTVAPLATAGPSPTAPPAPKHPSQPAPHPAAPAPTPPPAVQTEDFKVALEVVGHSETEVEILGSVLREGLAEKFGVPPEDIEMDIHPEGESASRHKDDSLLSWADDRRLTASELPVMEVDIRVRNLPANKRAEVQNYIKQQRTAMAANGVSQLGDGRRRPAPAPPPSPQSRGPAAAPTPPPPSEPSWPWKGWPWDSKPGPSPPPVVAPLPAPRAPAPVPAPIHLPHLAPRPAPAPKAPSVAAPTLQGVHARGMNYDRTATVNVLWGLSPSGATYELDPGFDMRAPAAQQALVDFCGRVEASEELKAFKTMSCWPREFAEWHRSRGGQFPSMHLASDLRDFASQRRNRDEFKTLREGEGVAWLSMEFRVEFDTHSSGRSTEPYMDAWEKFTEREAERLASAGHGARGLGRPVPASELFLRAEAELRVVGSALASWLCSVACALVAVGAFTCDFKLSAIATFAIFATAACSVFAITSIFKWRFGLMEAVSLIIFCGFSVDYPLHVVQAYVQERSQGAGVRQALREIGFAVGSGCVTTCGAAAFLLLCQIRIFTRFGQVLIVNMLFSIVFAVLWIPAVLEWRELRPAGASAKRAGSEAEAEAAAGTLTRADVPPEGFAVLPDA